MSRIQLRKEIDGYSRSCERLIVATGSPNFTPFTAEEIEWIAYYAMEMTNLAKRLPRGPKPQSNVNGNQSMQEYANASEAALGLRNLSHDERQSIKESVDEISDNILGRPKGSPDDTSVR
jgi:hypothetical protein